MLPNVNYIMMVHCTTDLGLIWVEPNPLSNAKMGGSILQATFFSNMHMDIKTWSFVDLKDILAETVWFEL